MYINHEPDMVFTKGAEIILIGTVEAETKFFEMYGEKNRL